MSFDGLKPMDHRRSLLTTRSLVRGTQLKIKVRIEIYVLIHQSNICGLRTNTEALDIYFD